MNPLSGDLTFVDASGWIALVSAKDTLHCHLADTLRVTGLDKAKKANHN